MQRQTDSHATIFLRNLRIAKQADLSYICSTKQRKCSFGIEKRKASIQFTLINFCLEALDMAIVRDGNKTVLMVVDVQVGVMQALWNADTIIKNIAWAIEKARTQGVPIFWIQHEDEELGSGTPQWNFVPQLSPANDEVVIHKQFNSSFENTSLEEILADIGATHIVLAGAATNWCIRATAYGALDRGYDLTLLKDAHTTETMELENDITIEAENIIRELNIAMNWLSYPGRVNSTVSVAELDFANQR